MSNVVSQIVRALAWALLVAMGLQIYFAGAFIFGSLSVEYHRAGGMFIVLGTLLTSILSLTTRNTRTLSKGFWGMFGVIVLQVAFIIVKPKFPGISALHAVNATVLVWLAHRLARRANAMVLAKAQTATIEAIPVAARTAA
jgi:hypothetical protein